MAIGVTEKAEVRLARIRAELVESMQANAERTPRGLLTREQAIEIAGMDAVLCAEAGNCEMTGRLLADNDSAVEYRYSVSISGSSDHDYDHLVAYYYPTTQELDQAGDDLSNVDWTVEGYQVI